MLFAAIHDRTHAFGAGAILRPDTANAGERNALLLAAILHIVIGTIGARDPGTARLRGRRQIALRRNMRAGAGEQARALVRTERAIGQVLDTPHHGVLVVHRLPDVAVDRAADGAGHVHVERQHELREAPVVAIAGIAARADEEAIVGLDDADLGAAVARLNFLLERHFGKMLLGEDAGGTLIAGLAARVERCMKE